MKMSKILALLLALAMVLSLAACGGSGSSSEPAADEGGASAAEGSEPAAEPAEEGGEPEAEPEAEPADEGGLNVEDSAFFGPIYDEWSEMTSDELYQAALDEADGEPIRIYATSSKMLKVEEDFEAQYPGLDLEIQDLDNDEVIEKCRLEVDSGNVAGDVMQAKDVSGDVFFGFYEEGYCSAFYPKDICEHIDETALRFGYPLYTSQSFWYYNTAEYPDGQPIHNWWEIIETNEDGTPKWKLFTKEIAEETAYMSLFTSFIVNADQMEQAYEDLYGEPLEYTYPTDGSWEFDFSQYENNAGVEYLWRFTQLADTMTFIGDGDELVQAVHLSANGPTLALASAGKIENQEESGYNIAWLTNLEPYTGLQNYECLYVVEGCPHPAAARLFIRWLTGDTNGDTDGLKPFQKTGNWVVRDDIEDEKNPVPLKETGAIDSDLAAIYTTFLDAQDMWIQWEHSALNG